MHTHTHTPCSFRVCIGWISRRVLKALWIKDMTQGVTQPAQGNIESIQSCTLCMCVCELTFKCSGSSSSQDPAVNSSYWNNKVVGYKLPQTDPSAVPPPLLYITQNLRLAQTAQTSAVLTPASLYVQPVANATVIWERKDFGFFFFCGYKQVLTGSFIPVLK